MDLECSDKVNKKFRLYFFYVTVGYGSLLYCTTFEIDLLKLGKGAELTKISAEKPKYKRSKYSRNDSN
jgi:hypothetical protein